jgi:polyisoprenoid-binding protein YceI
MTVVEERLPELVEKRGMVAKVPSERFEVVGAESSLTFFAMSTMQYVYGKTTELSGFIDVGWNGDGTLAVQPPPKMHVEFRVESLRTGNELQDREMWKLIDSKRFPKIAADLREASAGAALGRYTGTGQITLAGLARAYEGEFRLEREAKKVTLHGDLNVDVRDFGLKPLNLLVLSVAPLVRVRLQLVTARVV